MIRAGVSNPTGKLLAVSFGSLMICGFIGMSEFRSSPAVAPRPEPPSLALDKDRDLQDLRAAMIELYRRCLVEQARQSQSGVPSAQACERFSPGRMERLARQATPAEGPATQSSIPLYALLVSACSCIISLLGAISTAVLGWRKEVRELRGRSSVADGR